MKRTRHIQFFALAGIYLIALVLRFYGFPGNIQWQDTGMELLTATHVARYGEFPLLGIHAVSINFYHPPWYLYMLGLIYRVIPHITMLEAASLSFHALAVLPLFGAVTLLFGENVGVLTALLYAVNPYLVHNSYSLQSQYIIVPIIICVFYLWLVFRRFNKTWVSTLTTFALVGATTINYASLLIIPFICFIDMRNKDRKILALAWTAAFIFWYIPLFLYFGVGDTLRRMLLAPVTMLATPSVSDAYHFILFMPVILTIFSWLTVKLWNRIPKNPVRIILIVLIAGLMLADIYVSVRQASHGDLRQTLSCAQSVVTELEILKSKGAAPDSILFLGADTRDRRDHILSLVEILSRQKMVELDANHGYFRWIRRGDPSDLVCLGDADQTGNLSGCADAFMKIYGPSVELFGATKDRYCAMYRRLP